MVPSKECLLGELPGVKHPMSADFQGGDTTNGHLRLSGRLRVGDVSKSGYRFWGSRSPRLAFCPT